MAVVNSMSGIFLHFTFGINCVSLSSVLLGATVRGRTESNK